MTYVNSDILSLLLPRPNSPFSLFPDENKSSVYPNMNVYNFPHLTIFMNDFLRDFGTSSSLNEEYVLNENVPRPNYPLALLPAPNNVIESSSMIIV